MLAPQGRYVLAYTFGPRTDETCRELLALPAPFNIGMITSDNWGSYAREVPKDKHLTGRIFTQRIELNNLTLRTRIKRLARKTISPETRSTPTTQSWMPIPPHVNAMLRRKSAAAAVTPGSEETKKVASLGAAANTAIPNAESAPNP
ncbi:iso-IS1 ORF2 [Serratia sp. M24T3]|nr:iso-IS1 ORF2 [Serratia sp. M24T3]